MRLSALLTLFVVAVGCGGGDDAATTPPRSGVPASAPPAAPTPRREPLAGGPFPALVVAEAQFVDVPGPDGKPKAAPGFAKLQIVRHGPDGWTSSVLEDPDSNVFHKAVQTADGLLTIGGNKALLRVWTFADGAWKAVTRWNPTFGGKFDRLRDIEQGDVDGDGKLDWVVATHDQGVIAVLHPDRDWQVEEVDRRPDTFVHEIEIGDVDGDKVAEFFATPSKPNKLDQEQAGEVRMYKHGPNGWQKSIVDAPGDTHAKEILAADVDRDGTAELYVSWEGAVGPGNTLVRPVTVKQYRWKNGAPEGSVVGTVPDLLMRAITAGDVNGDGKIDLVAGALASGLWLFEQSPDGWKKSQIDAASSGFEHPVLLADLDGDGGLELYVASEDQGELRRYRWRNGAFEKTVLMPLHKGDITWNLSAAKQ